MENKDNKNYYNRVTFKNIKCLYCKGEGNIYFGFLNKWVLCDDCKGTGKRDYNLIECIKTRFDGFVLFNEDIKDKENEWFYIYVKDNPIKCIFLLPIIAISSINKDENTDIKYVYKLPIPVTFVDNFYVSHTCQLFDGPNSVMKIVV